MAEQGDDGMDGNHLAIHVLAAALPAHVPIGHFSPLEAGAWPRKSNDIFAPWLSGHGLQKFV